MAAAGQRRLTCQALLNRLAKFGIHKVRQRGSHVVVQRPEAPGSTKGPTYPFPCPAPTKEVSEHIIRALLRRFDIDEERFWSM